MSDQPVADDLADTEEQAHVDADEAIDGSSAEELLESELDTAIDSEEPPSSAEELLAQRDGYLNDLQRVTAEFANYRRKAAERQQEREAAAEAGIVEKMLPVLDACEAAVAQGVDDVIPIRDALYGALEKEGLVRLDDPGAPFDPNCHEAVVHEPGDGEAVIAEVLRAGYQWNSRVLRPAMVKVKG